MICGIVTPSATRAAIDNEITAAEPVAVAAATATHVTEFYQ